MTDHSTVTQWLQQGIAAAKAGDTATARALLRRVTTEAPDNLAGWLWSSSVAETLLDRETCLLAALKLEPNHAQARAGLVAVQEHIIADLLQRSATALTVGRREAAHNLLTELVGRDSRNLTGWLRLSQIVESPEDKILCYENVLTLDPQNAEAQTGLAALQMPPELSAEDFDDVFNPWRAPAADAVPTAAEVSPVIALLGAEYVERYLPPLPETPPEPESPATARWHTFDNHRLCPYCATPTQAHDSHCAACGNPLWMLVRRVANPSSAYWILVACVLAVPFWTMIAIVGAFMVLARSFDIADSTKLLPLYLGLAHDLAPAVAAQILSYLPRLTFFIAAGVVIFSFSALALLLLRHRFALAFLWGYLAVVIAFSSGELVFYHSVLSIIAASAGIAVPLGLGIWSLQVQNDLAYDNVRLLLQLDKGLKTATDFLLRGRAYAKDKMWALSAIHLRRAAAMMPAEPTVFITLAVVCIHLNEYVMAESALATARSIDATLPAIEELSNLLAERRMAAKAA